MIKRKQYINAWINIVSILMFFLTFFTAYFLSQFSLIPSFLRGFLTLIISQIVAKIIVFVWMYSMPSDDWRLMVKGPPKLLKRADLLLKQDSDEHLEDLAEV